MNLYEPYERRADEILEDALRDADLPPEDSEFWGYGSTTEYAPRSLTNEEMPVDELGDKEVAAMNAELLTWAGDVLVKGRVKGEGKGREIGPAVTTMLKPDGDYKFKFEFRSLTKE